MSVIQRFVVAGGGLRGIRAVCEAWVRGSVSVGRCVIDDSSGVKCCWGR